jgi:hypothetical protein
VNGATGLAVGLGVGIGVGGSDDSEGFGVWGIEVSGFDIKDGLVVLGIDGSDGFGVEIVGFGVWGIEVSGFGVKEGLVVLAIDGSDGFKIGVSEDGLSVVVLVVAVVGESPPGLVDVDVEALETDGETFPDLF